MRHVRLNVKSYQEHVNALSNAEASFNKIVEENKWPTKMDELRNHLNQLIETHKNGVTDTESAKFLSQLERIDENYEKMKAWLKEDEIAIVKSTCEKYKTTESIEDFTKYYNSKWLHNLKNKIGL